MFKHFMIVPFLIGIALGIAGFYFVKPQEMVVYKYPTPDNAGKVSYKDKNGVCYSYTAKEVGCDKHEGTIRPYPVA